MFTTHQRTKGQALVEFALAATLIFVLLSAAIDLGLIFFRHQGLYNASLEGASYGSRFVKTFTAAQMAGWSDEERARRGCAIPNATQAICIDEDVVRQRIINEDGSGNGGGTSLVNLKDLNGDGIPDDPDVQNEYIIVKAVSDETKPDDAASACPDITNPPGVSLPNCYIYVKLKSDYHMFFALAPAFGDSVTVSASTLYPIRAQIQTGSDATPGTVATNTPTPIPTNTPTPSSTPITPGTDGNPLPPSDGSTATLTPSKIPDDSGGNPGTEDPPGTGETPATDTPAPSDTPKPTRTATKTNTPGPSPTQKPTKTPGPTNTRGPSPTHKPTSKPTSVGTRVPGKPSPTKRPQTTPTNEGT